MPIETICFLEYNLSILHECYKHCSWVQVAACKCELMDSRRTLSSWPSNLVLVCDFLVNSKYFKIKCNPRWLHELCCYFSYLIPKDWCNSQFPCRTNLDIYFVALNYEICIFGEVSTWHSCACAWTFILIAQIPTWDAKKNLKRDKNRSEEWVWTQQITYVAAFSFCNASIC